LRADVQQAVDSKEHALARDGCAAADYRLSGALADRFCSLHLMRDWRMIVGFPAPKEVAVLLIGRHIHGSQRDVYTRFYSSLGITVPSAQRKKPPCCEETGTAPWTQMRSSESRPGRKRSLAAADSERVVVLWFYGLLLLQKNSAHSTCDGAGGGGRGRSRLLQ